MPIIQFNMMEHRTDEQKRELAKRVCATVADVLQCSPDTVRIMIHELGPCDFSVGGITMEERMKQKNSGVTS